MKVNTLITSNRLFLSISLMIGVIFAIGVFLSVSMQAQNQTQSDEQRAKQLEEESKERAQMFWKTSSTKIPADEGNKIVAVRRINLTVDDYDAKGNKFKKKKLIYEVELFSRLRIPVTSSMQYLIIGDSIISQVHVNGSSQTIFGHLEQEQFELIKDGAIISYTISPVNLSLQSEIVKESYKNGEPEKVAGAKFGRIDKKAADRFPLIEEDSETLLLRITRTKTN